MTSRGCGSRRTLAAYARYYFGTFSLHVTVALRRIVVDSDFSRNALLLVAGFARAICARRLSGGCRRLLLRCRAAAATAARFSRSARSNGERTSRCSFARSRELPDARLIAVGPHTPYPTNALRWRDA